MPLRPWLRRTLWGAFILSLLMHVASIFSEEIYAWLTQPEFEQTELKKPTRKLKAQTLEEEAQAALAGIKPPETLQVYLRRPRPPKTVKKLAPKPAPAALPSRVIASTPQPAGPVIVSETLPAPVASVVASLPASVSPAPASMPQIASAPAVHPGEKHPNQELARFPNELKITYVYGIIPGHMTWKMVNGHYDLQLEGSFLFSSRIFHSSGKVNKNGVTPDRFVEYRNGKPDPYYQVDFDWKMLTAEVGEPGKRKTEAISAGDQDIFSTAFHVGLIGGTKPEQTFSIFSGRRKYPDAHLMLVGEAKLRLGEKEVDALLLRGEWGDRKVDFWLAPEWNNIPVRMTIVLGKELSIDLWANEVSIEGKKVLEWVKPQSRQPSERSSNK